MALRPLQPIGQPLGQFDSLDADVSVYLGGEVVMFTQTVVPGDLGAVDAFDGYSVVVSGKRPVITKTIVSGKRPLFLADEGIAGYGTLIGSVVGGTTGQHVSGTVVGPSTAVGSGKVTLWMGGLFAISLDAVDTTSSTGLTVTNSSIVGGDALYVTSAGKLTPTVGSAVDSTIVGRFIEFTTNNSLVNTPAYLVSGVNGNGAPGGITSNWTSGSRAFTWAVVYFAPPVS